MLRVHSGDVAIIGGLMQESVRETDRQIPGAAGLPFIGRLFSQKSRNRTLTELLVVLRPTIMPVNAEQRRQ
jgi:general secretion pathway protein D